MIILALIIITYLFVYNIILVRELIKTSGTLGKGNSPTDVLNKTSDIKLPEEYLSHQKNDGGEGEDGSK